MGKTGEDKTDYIRVDLKNVGPTFFKFISICTKVSFICFSEIILVCHVTVILQIKDCFYVELIINKNKQLLEML